MLLPPDEVELFYKLHRSLMHFVNQRLSVVPDIAGPEAFAGLIPQSRWKVRNAFLDNVGLIEPFLAENPADLSADERDIVSSWHQQVSGRFYAFRQLKNYMVFLSMADPPVAYGVVALTDPFEFLIGPHLPVLVDTVLMPFKDKIIYDGLLKSFNITFGGGIKRNLNDSYREAKERLGVVTSLPIESLPISATKAKEKRKPKKPASSSRKPVQSILEAIVSATDGFCRDRLNDEYAELCRKLAEKLSRKRPSPLLSGKPQTWASGIIRVIGWVNFLDDPTTHPHMKLTAIDEALGVSKSTGQAKSLEIRKMLKIHQFEVEWTLPSRMDANPRAWLVEVNGFVIDVRHEPREVQEIAFEKGLIPYIPGDRKTGSSKVDDKHDAVSPSGQPY